MAGRDLYDAMVAETDARLAAGGSAQGAAEGHTRVDVAAQVWRERLPPTERELAVQGLGFFRYRRGPVRPGADHSLPALLGSGALVAEPIVYEDFLPRSAAGIFASNLTAEGARDDLVCGTPYDLTRLSVLIERPVHDPVDLYAAQQQASLDAAQASLGLHLDPTPARRPLQETSTR